MHHFQTFGTMMLSAGRLLESTVTTTTATVSNTITNPAQPPTVAIVFDDAAAVFAAICACAFSAIGILGNLITILALALNPKLRSHATTAFVLSLCVSDLLFCSVSLPLTAVRYINKVSDCGYVWFSAQLLDMCIIWLWVAIVLWYLFYALRSRAMNRRMSVAMSVVAVMKCNYGRQSPARSIVKKFVFF